MLLLRPVIVAVAVLLRPVLVVVAAAANDLCRRRRRRRRPCSCSRLVAGPLRPTAALRALTVRVSLAYPSHGAHVFAHRGPARSGPACGGVRVRVWASETDGGPGRDGRIHGHRDSDKLTRIGGYMGREPGEEYSIRVSLSESAYPSHGVFVSGAATRNRTARHRRAGAAGLECDSHTVTRTP